ncbi:ECF transporter S component [Microbacterium sp. NPDC055903]
MTRTPAPPRLATRTLLTLAAIGVAIGLVVIPTAWLAQVLWVAAPPFYGIAVVPYVLAGAIAQALVPRGGSALITGVIAGLVALPFTGGFGPLSLFIFVAVLQELPYAVTLWRRWGTTMAFVAAGVLSAGYAAYWWFILDAEVFPPAIRLLAIGLLVGTIFIATTLGLVIARALRRAGVARR